MQVPGVEFTESFSTFASDTSTRILIGLTLYYEDYGWIVELCDIEVAFLYPNTEVDMYIEWPEGILYLGIITKEFLEEYCILLVMSMYGNVDAVLLWLRLLAEYLVNEFNVKMSKAESFIFFRKDEKFKLDIVMSVHVDDVFMAGKSETLETLNKISRRISTYQSPEKQRIFLGSITNVVKTKKVHMQK